jgi:uncharacterized protein YqgV (UPF0045/DUF77 family)
MGHKLDTKLKEITVLAKLSKKGELNKKQRLTYETLLKEITPIIERENNPITLYALRLRFYEGFQWDEIGDILGKLESDGIRKACYRSYTRIKRETERKFFLMSYQTVKELTKILKPYEEYRVKLGSLDTPIEETERLSKVMIDPELKEVFLVGDYDTRGETRENINILKRKEIEREIREEAYYNE